MNKSIADYSTGEEQEFLASRLIKDGVVRNLGVIGEATKNLSTELREANPVIRAEKPKGVSSIPPLCWRSAIN